MKEVADKVYRLEVPIPRMNIASGIYLIKESKGILIEPGPAIAVPYIQEGMKKLGVKDLAYIIPTHMHVDHAGSIGTLARLFPEAKVVVHPRGEKHAIDPSQLIESTRMVWGADFEANLGPIVPVPESQILVAEDGERLSVDGRELQIIYAPGHAPHQIVVYDRNVSGIFCGDALGLMTHSAKSFPLPNSAPPGFDQELYLKTMEKLRQLRARALFYSHGEVEYEPDALISMAAENTRVFGKIVSQALAEGKTPEAIIGMLREHIMSRFGLEVDDFDLEVCVAGYIFYFKKKGLASDSVKNTKH